MTETRTQTEQYRGYNCQILIHEERSHHPDLGDYGDLTARILATDDLDSSGGLIIYSEHHDSELISVNDLRERLRDTVNRINSTDEIGLCDACENLYNGNHGNRPGHQTLTWSERHVFDAGMDPRYKRTETQGRSNTCVWTTGRVFDTLHIVTHRKDRNPVYSEKELVECESLMATQGFERTGPDGEVRSLEEIVEKRRELKRKTARGRSARKNRKSMLEFLDWILGREDRFWVDERF